MESMRLASSANSCPDTQVNLRHPTLKVESRAVAGCGPARQAL